METKQAPLEKLVNNIVESEALRGIGKGFALPAVGGCLGYATTNGPIAMSLGVLAGICTLPAIRALVDCGVQSLLKYECEEIQSVSNKEREWYYKSLATTVMSTLVIAYTMSRG